MDIILLENRIALFCILYNLLPKISWKSKKYFDEEKNPMFNDNFKQVNIDIFYNNFFTIKKLYNC